MLRPTLIKSASEEAKQFSFAYADYADAETRKANPFQTSFPPSRSRWRQWRFMHPFFHRATTEQKPTYFTASKIRREREWESGRGCWCRFTVEVKVMGVNGLSGVPLPLAGFLSTPSRPLFPRALLSEARRKCSPFSARSTPRVTGEADKHDEQHLVR